MSIAVSTLIHPSKHLSMMLAAMVGLILLVALLIGMGIVGALSFAARIALALLLAISALGLFRHWYLNQRLVRLSVSGTGQLRLQKWPATDDARDGHAEVMSLLPTSTIWSSLLILHLQDSQRRTEVVLILRDSVSPDAFNALLVACRWLAMREPETERPQERQN